MSIVPQRAAVRPCVVTTGDGPVVPLEWQLAPIIERAERGAVAIVGGRGMGKTAALRHIAAMCPTKKKVELLDEPPGHTVRGLAEKSLVIFTYSSKRKEAPVHTIEQFRLAPWGADQWLEYLINKHRGRCDSVMKRLLAAKDMEELDGIPRLTALVLDQMASVDGLPGARATLQRFIDGRLTNEDARARLAAWCLDHLVEMAIDEDAEEFGIAVDCITDPELYAVFSFRAPQRMLAMDRVLSDLREEETPFYFRGYMDPGLMQGISERAAVDEWVRERLEGMLEKEHLSECHPKIASMLHAAGVGWRPGRRCRANLSGANLAGVSWPQIEMGNVVLRNANLSRANLQGCVLNVVNLADADLSGANLSWAKMRRVNAAGARLRGANLTRVDAGGLNAVRADFSGADLMQAALPNAGLMGADLRNAKLVGADLSGARFDGAQLEGADLSEAVLCRARLEGLDLRGCELAGANLREALLVGSNLEGQEMPLAMLEEAKLRDALLTNSVMPKACFIGADLRNTGLAGISWPGADLRDADLQGASFHAGTSRSGLVGSPIASEGSRSGFYTDDYYDQHYRTPEAIRKADLREADFRGAHVLGTDFYLVDIRGARYDADQAEHFQKCRAIMEEWRGEEEECE